MPLFISTSLVCVPLNRDELQQVDATYLKILPLLPSHKLSFKAIYLIDSSYEKTIWEVLDPTLKTV